MDGPLELSHLKLNEGDICDPVRLGNTKIFALDNIEEILTVAILDRKVWRWKALRTCNHPGATFREISHFLTEQKLNLLADNTEKVKILIIEKKKNGKEKKKKIRVHKNIGPKKNFESEINFGFI